MTERTKVRLTPLQIGLLAMLVASASLNYLDRQALGAIAPTLKTHFQLTTQEWGWINSAFSLVYIFSTLLGGAWIDRVGVRKGLLISTIVWSVAAVGHVFASGFWSLCFWRMLLALGEGPGLSSLLKGVRRVMPPQMRDTGTGLVGAGWTFGALAAPLVIVPLAVKFGWQTAFVLTAGLCLVWIPLWLALAFRSESNLGPTAEVQAGSDERPQLMRWRSWALWATLLAVFFAVPPTVFTNNFLSLYLSKTHGLSQSEIGWVLWKPFLATDLGQIAGGFAAFALLRRGWHFLNARRLVMLVGLVGSAVIIGLNFTTDATVAVWWMNASRFLFQCAYTVLLAYGIESVAENQTALMAGLMNATFSACNFFFNPLIGWLADNHGYRPVVTLIALTPLAGLACWLALSHQHARRAIS